MARVLIAGSGYVGARLALSLRAAGHEVYAIKRRPAELEGIEIVVADITQPLTLPRVDVAVFTAAPSSRGEHAYRAIYIDGLRHVSEALDGRTRLLFVSSTAVYGQDDAEFVDESSPTQPRGFRGQVLLEAEATANVVLRLGGIYGPGRARALERVRAGDATYQPGRMLNLIHRDDASGALEHLMFLSDPRPVYVGVDEEPVDSESLYRWVANESGAPPPSAEGGNTGLGKRCSSALLGASGYVFKYPTYRHGYGELVKRRISGPDPRTPNFVSSLASEPGRRVTRWGFGGSADEVRATLRQALEALGGRVVVAELDYLRAEFSSSVFGFVDDVELSVDATSKTIDVRSASRVGWSDFGANRRRVRKLGRRLVRTERIWPL